MDCREQFGQYRGRNNLDFGKRGCISKVTVRRSLFIRIRWGPSGGEGGMEGDSECEDH